MTVEDRREVLSLPGSVLSGQGTDWRRPAGAVLLPVAVAVGLGVARHPRVIYTSDSTAQQSIVRTWLDVGHGVTHLPADTWALKFPLYLVLENLPLTPMQRLLAAVVTLTAVTFALLGVAVLRLAPRARWYEVAAPLTCLAAVGGGFGSNRNLPNYRNIELGLCFLLLAAVATYLTAAATGEPAAGGRRIERSSAVRPFAEIADAAWTGGRGRRYLAATAAVLLPAQAGSRRRYLAWTAAVLLPALLWFDDPYFALLVGAPLAVASVAWFLLRDRDIRLLRVAGALLGSLALLPVLQFLVRAAGVQIDRTSQLAPGLATLVQDLELMVRDTATQFGVGRWEDVPAPVAAIQSATVLTLGAMVVLSAVLVRHGWRRGHLVPFFIGLNWPLVLLGTLAQAGHPSRYLILAHYDLAVATVLVLPLLRARGAGRGSRSLVVALGLTAAGTAWLGTATALDAARRPSAGLAEQEAVVRAVQDTGVAKGFAPFWSANITSYRAGGGRTIHEVECLGGRLATRSWLSDTARLNRPARATFLIWTPAYEAAGCTAPSREALLGPAVQAYSPVPGTRVLVYPYDIAERLRGR